MSFSPTGKTEKILVVAKLRIPARNVSEGAEITLERYPHDVIPVPSAPVPTQGVIVIKPH